MRQKVHSFKSLAQYDLDRVLENKRNLGQVQSVLSLYENNNSNLISQVESLIRQNQMLRRRNVYVPITQQKSRLTKLSLKDNNQISRTYQQSSCQTNADQTAKKQTSFGNKLNHPRNAYLAGPQIRKMQAIKLFKQAKTAHKTYDRSRQYEQFKQKLSEKKKQLKKSMRTKSNFEYSNSHLQMSRNVYLEEESDNNQQRAPLREVKREDFNNIIKASNKKQQTAFSPYKTFQKQTPQKYAGNMKQVGRSSSAIKIQQVYPQNSIRIAEPRTKWGDLSSTYFQKTKLSWNNESVFQANPKAFETSSGVGKSENSKKSRRKFLSVVSSHLHDGSQSISIT